MPRTSVLKCWLIRIIALAFLAILLDIQGIGNVVNVRAQSPTSLPSNTIAAWEYQLDFSAATSVSASRQANSVSSSLGRQGATVSLQSTGAGQYRLSMSGSQGLEQLRQVLFSPLLAGFIGGPAEIEMTLPASGLENVSLQLESNLSTGYSWEVIGSETSGFTQQSGPSFATRSAGYGVAGLQSLALRPTTNGGGKIKLAYRRPFGPVETVTRHLTIAIGEPMSSIDLSNPHPKAIVRPPAFTSPSTTNPTSLPAQNSSLPASLDWRDAGIVPAVRNQGSCGSCWAFGTVGIMESAIANIGAPLTDLSEQYLVSCNTNGWNCDDGGLTAHMWHYDLLGKNQTVAGAVLETEMPYTATNGSCNMAYQHPYTLSGWKFITSNEWTIPSVDQIKSAIAAYGPVTAGVCAGYAFQTYRSGVFSTNEDCHGWTNHQIILVGWKDTSATEGYWILRNSWGSWWGENGYMRIAYNTSRVGEGTSWVMWGSRYYFPLITR